MFQITPMVREMADIASSIQARQELAVTIALAALNVALSAEPVQPTDRQIERRESRAAAKQFEATVAGKGPVGATDAEPVQPVKQPSIFNRPRAELQPDQLERVRQLTRERQQRWRAKAKAV